MTESRACSQVSYRYREPSSTWAEGEPSPSHGSAAANNPLATTGAQPLSSLANTHLLFPQWELVNVNICGKVGPSIGASVTGSRADSGAGGGAGRALSQRERLGCLSPGLSPTLRL